MMKTQVDPVTKPAPESYLGSGKRNTETEESRGNIRILSLQSVDYPQFFGRLVRFFDFPDECIFTGGTLRQDNWKRSGLYVNIEYLDRRNGTVNLIIATTSEPAAEIVDLLLAKLARRPVSVYQGVLE